jgi:hypothetical protein
MKQGIQTLMGEAGEAACYALCIIEIAERATGNYIDPIDAFLKAFDRKYIYYNDKDPNDNNNFFVDNPSGFLSMLAGGKWTVEKAAAGYVPYSDEYVVDCWERSATGKKTVHFRLADWDSLTSSLTVRLGNIVSKRVFKRTS